MTPAEKAHKLAEQLIEFHQFMLDKDYSDEEIIDRLRLSTGRPEFLYRTSEESDEHVVREVQHRKISCLTRADDESLLKEVRRRGLSSIKVTMQKEEFEKEARTRGYKRFLSEFPRGEINTYLKIQGLSK
ncbi:MAG: hypothetical protein P1V97_20255 [Planctomycetota bacterium]|nr:hypothetical protein [Planctomycetota bacterium]